MEVPQGSVPQPLVQEEAQPVVPPCMLVTDMAPATVEVEIETDGNGATAPPVGSVETVEAPGCSSCVVLQKELDDCKRDRAFFVDIKRKMILTDTLIQKHQSKCQAFDEQQRKLQEVTMKLAQAKRDCKVLEEQLTTTLKDIIPWKRDKERFLKELEQSKQQNQDLHNTIKAQETLVMQLENKAEQCDEEKAVLESDLQVMKADFDGFKSKERKLNAALDKSKDDVTKLKKELSEVKKSRSTLSIKFGKAETRIEALQKRMIQHGIKPPRSRSCSTLHRKDESDAVTDLDEGDIEAVTMATRSHKSSGTPTRHPLPHANSLRTHLPPPSYHPAPITASPRRARPFPKMDFDAVTCLSPLPPSPGPEVKEEDDHFLTDIAAKIDAKLSTPSALGKQQAGQKDNSLVAPTRFSPRRRRREYSSSETQTKNAGSDDVVSDSGSCRSLRSGKKILSPTPSIAVGALSLRTGIHSSATQRTGLRASKKLNLESEEDVPKQDSVGENRRATKSRRGRKRKSDEALREKNVRDRAELEEKLTSGRVVEKISTLSSSDEEGDVIAQRRTDGRQLRPPSAGIRTRSKARQSSTAPVHQASVDSNHNDIAVRNDLDMSSDEESKHSPYNPQNSDSDGSSIVVTRRKRKSSSSAHTPKRASALSETSESEDEQTRMKLNSKKNSVKKSTQPSSETALERSEHQIHSEASTAKQERNSSDKDTTDMQAVSLTSNDDVRGDLVEGTRPMDSDNSGKSDTSANSKSVEDVPSEENTTGQNKNAKLAHPRLVRSVSGPPNNRLQTISMDRKHGYSTRSSSRDQGNSSSEDIKDVKICSSRKVTNESGGDDAHHQQDAFTASRLTRSKSRLTAPDSGAEESSLVSRRRRLGSRKRALSDSQVSSDEVVVQKGVDSLENGSGAQKATGNMKEERTESDDVESKAETKVLVRSQTEEFVACMDDAPNESKKQTKQSDTRKKSNHVDTKDESHFGKRRCTRRTPVTGKRGARLGRSNDQVSSDPGTERDKDIEPNAVDEQEQSLGGVTQNEYEAHWDMPSTSGRTRVAHLPQHRTASTVDGQRFVPETRERQSSTVSLESSERNSPLSPIQEPFQNLAFTRPISPMSPERPVERVSPILPSMFFDLPAFPRMVSPLPPSPPQLLREDSLEDAGQDEMPAELPDMMPEPEVQPRMISPLFPTPVPFAVSPIAELAVPPAISPIPDIQHPHEISPLTNENEASQSDPLISPIRDDQSQPETSQSTGNGSQSEILPTADNVSPPEISRIRDNATPPNATSSTEAQLPVSAVKARTPHLISPGKSPQLPSPRIFHSVAPSDAITVRPQHSGPGAHTQDKRAARSLNALLHRENSSEDHRSSFSQKLIARRSSGDEQANKSEDKIKVPQPSVPIARRRSSAHEPHVGNLSCSALVDRRTVDEPLTSSEGAGSEISAGSVVKTQKPGNSGISDDMKRIEKLSTRFPASSVKQHQMQVGSRTHNQVPMASKAQSDFNAHLRRVSGTEGVTAFSRVIRHREENKMPSLSAAMVQSTADIANDTPDTNCEGPQPTPSEVTRARTIDDKRKDYQTAGTSRVPAGVTPGNVVQGQPVTTEVKRAAKSQGGDGEVIKPAKRKSTVGNIWAQMASETKAQDKREESHEKGLIQKFMASKKTTVPKVHKVTELVISPQKHSELAADCRKPKDLSADQVTHRTACKQSSGLAEDSEPFETDFKVPFPEKKLKQRRTQTSPVSPGEKPSGVSGTITSIAHHEGTPAEPLETETSALLHEGPPGSHENFKKDDQSIQGKQFRSRVSTEVSPDHPKTTKTDPTRSLDVLHDADAEGQGKRRDGQNLESSPATTMATSSSSPGSLKASQTADVGEPGKGDKCQMKVQTKIQLNHVLKVIREQCPNRFMAPVGDCIVQYLEQNCMDLFPAIYAKTIVCNTSAEPIISPIEEQISKAIFLWTKEIKRKNMMHNVLMELSRRLATPDADDAPSVKLSVTLCRLFVAICRDTNWIARVRILCYDIVRENLPNTPQLLLAIAAVWPAVLRRKDGSVHAVTSTVEAVVMHQLQSDMQDSDQFKKEEAEKISKCFSHLCGWQPVVSESWQESHCLWLVSLLKDGKISAFIEGKTPPTLGPKCFEIIKALELLASVQGWEWTNNQLVIEKLWPILKDWSKSQSKKKSDEGSTGTSGEGSLQDDKQPCTTTATACAVMRVMGNLSQIGLVTHVQSVEQLMKMLIAVLQQPSESIPWPMQLFTAQSICDLSPSNKKLASEVLQAWRSKSSNAIPAKLAERITNLGRRKKEKKEGEDELSKLK